MSDAPPEEIDPSADPPKDPPADPPEDPDKAELARLRKAEQDRIDAERAEEKAELERLRKDAEAREKVPPPKKKVADPPADPPKEPPKKARVSSKWFGSSAYDD